MTERTQGVNAEQLKIQQERIAGGIRRIMRAVDVKSHRLAQKEGVTRPQLMNLRYIGRNTGANATELARRFHLSPSTVVGILDRLESKGYIERARETTDRRVVNISITRAGERFLRRVIDPVMQTIEASINGHSVDDIRRIADGTDELAALLDWSEDRDSDQPG
jgi:DNA-binding MarR family transcriptional regulator